MRIPYTFGRFIYGLIAVNVVVFFIQRNFPVTSYYLAMIPALVREGFLWQFVTYMFAHGGFSHILFNMLGLYIFGFQVEREMGSYEFLLYYLATGIFAGIASFAVYVAMGTEAALLGASGALFAVELAFAAYFPDAVVYIFGIVPVRAPVLVLGYTALELFFSVTGMRAGVAHMTHLFGFAAGWLYLMARFRINPWKSFFR
ncbi:MAG: rhomboid family intramembrane serine protease [Treponema sp.]|jgi:membrane associated rhomboid family serine protease|nr:rhomboid family intramembrane serine protease [Treponema sp.]